MQFRRSYALAVNQSNEVQVFAAQSDVWAAGVPNVWIRDGNAFGCKWALSAGGCEWEIEAEDSARWVVNRAVVVCNAECNGYFHFTHDHLWRIALVHHELMSDPDLNIILPTLSTRKAPFIRQYLHDVLGIPYARMMAADAKIRVWPRTWATVFVRWAVYPQPGMCGKLPTYPLYLLRKIAFRRLGLHHAKPPQREGPFRLLLAERTGSRMPVNWVEAKGELATALPKVEFYKVMNVTVIGQMRAFNSADMVIGPHGANLANMMWMRHGTTVLELMSYNYGNMCYYASASRLGLLHRFILHEGMKNETYSVSGEEMRRHIDDAIRRDEGREPLVFD